MEYDKITDFPIKHPVNDTETSLKRLSELRKMSIERNYGRKGYYITKNLMIESADVDVIQDIVNPEMYRMVMKIKNPLGYDQNVDHWFTFDMDEIEDFLKEHLLRSKEYLKELNEITDLKLREL